jgi:hypothetical protein
MVLNVKSFLRDKTLVFTVTSDGYKYLTWNLQKYLEKLNIALCILCLDKESNDFFNRIAMIPSRLYGLDGPHVQHKSPTLFGSTAFKRMNRMKLKALQELSQHPDVEILLYLDSDIAVFRDPLPAVTTALQETPLWFQCDEKQEAVFVCSRVDHCPNACSGVIAMHLTDETRPLFHKLYTVEEGWKEAVGDQDYINERTQRFQIPYKTLPRDTFPNGVFLTDNRFRQGDPILLHFNYVIGNDKKRFMKNKDCWLLQDY